MPACYFLKVSPSHLQKQGNMKTINIYLAISMMISQVTIGQQALASVDAMDHETVLSFNEPSNEYDAQVVTPGPAFVLNGPEAMPKFPGGKKELFSFLANKVKYPAQARNKGVQGVVYVQFIVLEDGTVDENNIHVVQSVHPDLDREAMRVVKEMPQWTPAMQGDRAMPVSYTLPFRFTLQ